MDAEFYAELWRELALDGIDADKLDPRFNLASTDAWRRLTDRRHGEMMREAIANGALRLPPEAPPRLSLWQRLFAPFKLASR